jgi:hypothetical protein
MRDRLTVERDKHQNRHRVFADDQRSLIAQAVAERARAARPAVSVAGDVCRINWPEGVGVVALLCWITPREMIDALAGELSELPNAMPQSERLKCVAELEAELDQLERREVVLVEYALENGVDVLPRHEPACLSWRRDRQGAGDGATGGVTAFRSRPRRIGRVSSPPLCTMGRRGAVQPMVTVFENNVGLPE